MTYEVKSHSSVDYLTHQLHSRRAPIAATVFNRDPNLGSRIDQYEEDLLLFLKGENILKIGNNLQKSERELNVAPGVFSRGVSRFERVTKVYQEQRKVLAEDLQSLNARISGIGRERLQVDDFDLLLGRLQVRLWHLETSRRLSLWGKLAKRLIGARQVHPAIESYQDELDELDERLLHMGERKKAMVSKHMRQESGMQHHLQDEQERLFRGLDTWATGSTDRFLVHYLYYQRPDLESYLRRHKLGDEELRKLLILKQTTLRPQPVRQILQVADKELPVETTTKLSLPIKLGEKVIDDIATAREEFEILAGDLPKGLKRQIFNRLVKALVYESQGSHHPDSKLLKGDDTFDRIGGNWRLRVGRYRLVGNVGSFGNWPKLLELSQVLQRDDPKYH